MKNFLFLSALLVGCGGGVSDSKRLSDLSNEEARDLCLELVDDYPEKTVTCGSTMFTIGFTAAECTDQGPEEPSCTATAGNIRECTAAIYALTDTQLCDPNAAPPPACAEVLLCG